MTSVPVKKDILFVNIFFDARNGRVAQRLRKHLSGYGTGFVDTISAGITVYGKCRFDLIVLGVEIVDLENKEFGELDKIRTQIERLRRSFGTSRIVLFVNLITSNLIPLADGVLSKSTAEALTDDVKRLIPLPAQAA